uniref:Nuclear cap-binding protein subunit 1 n=1 Tax=Globodera rostochiensis TaxID=31243 RepID=A0A914HHC5_GLORO
MFSMLPKKRRGDAEENEMDIEGAEMKKKKLPTGEDIQPKLVTMIKKLDEELNGASVESAIESLTNVLEENLEPYEGQIIHILFECAAYLPEKITIFSTLVGLLNARSSDFGERLLLKFVDEFHYTVMNGEYDISVRLATFLCDLCNARVVTPHSVILFLDNFVDLATDENIKSNFFVYLVLHTLPWVGLELNDKLPTKLNDLMGRISLYLNRRQKSHINILKVWAAEEYPQQEDYLDSLWSQLQKLREQNWEEKHILRTYAFFESVLATSVQQELPDLNRDVLENSKNHPLPRIVFRLFDKNDCVESEIALPASNSIERFLVEEDLNWIIDNNYLDWKLCAQALLNYHRKETVPLNYVMIETVFNQLFRLPAAPHHELFYGALLIELCRSEANTMPQVLALAAELLYRVTDTMQPICLDRFVNWFSYHLSNFEYRWSWSDWIECVKLDSLHPRRIFVREVIDKCLRLSYHKKVVGFLPPELAPIIPDEPSIVYILDDAQHPAFSKAEQFRALISNKVEDEEILAALRISTDDIDEGAEQRNEFSGEYSVDAVAIFFAVLLKLSSRTFTHTFSAFTRYHKTLSLMTANNEEMQSTILRTLYDAWILHKQILTITVDKLMKMRILDPSIVVAWVFSEEMKVEFKRTWVWETLNVAVTYLERQCKAEAKKYTFRREFLEKLEQRQRKGKRRADNGQLEGVGDGVRGVKMEQELGTNASQESSRMRVIAPNVAEFGDVEAMDFDGFGAGTATGGGEDDDAMMGLDERITVQEESLRCAKTDLDRCDIAMRDVLLIICHKFTLILSEHLLNCETDGADIETNFYNYVVGRFKYVFLRHAENMWHFDSDLDRELFSLPTIGPRIRAVFEQFRLLRR